MIDTDATLTEIRARLAMADRFDRGDIPDGDPSAALYAAEGYALRHAAEYLSPLLPAIDVARGLFQGFRK